MDLEIGDMGVLDPLGLSVAPPAPGIEEGGSGGDVMAAMAGAASFALADQAASISAPSQIAMAEGSAANFSGTMDAVAFDGSGLGGLPEIPVSMPDTISGIGVPDAPGAVGPGVYATGGGVEGASFSGVEDGMGGGLGNLPFVEAPTPGPISFTPPAASLDEFVDMQLQIAPPEPAQLDLTTSPEPVSAPMASQPMAPLGVEHQSSSLSSMEQAALAAFGPIGGFGSSQGGGSAPGGVTVQIQNLSLPGAKTGAVLSDLASLSRSGTPYDLSALGD